jgi:adenosylmethionine-8-amino-7-oxononanoate aminotransferase
LPFVYSYWTCAILIAPPLIITADQLREEMAKMDEVLYEVDRMIEK